MSKQDRQGVRTPADIERKYPLGKLNAFRGDSSKQDTVISELTQKVDQFIADTNANIDTINNSISGFDKKVDDAIDKSLAEAKASGEFDGEKGDPGEKGDAGVSPTVTVSSITGGHRVTITDATDVETFDVMDGKDGADATPYGNKVLWSGNDVMGANTVINLSEAISKQPSGVVLVFSIAGENHHYSSHFVPKYVVQNHSNVGHIFTLFRNYFAMVATKYLYIKDTAITGNAGNTSSGTASGISYNGNNWALRYVLGV